MTDMAMTKIVTFWGDTKDQDGLPVPYHVYLICEGTADWLPAGDVAAMVLTLNADTPAPSSRPIYLANKEGAATDKAITALTNMPQNKGLKKHLTEFPKAS